MKRIFFTPQNLAEFFAANQLTVIRKSEESEYPSFYWFSDSVGMVVSGNDDLEIITKSGATGEIVREPVSGMHELFHKITNLLN